MSIEIKYPVEIIIGRITFDGDKAIVHSADAKLHANSLTEISEICDEFDYFDYLIPAFYKGTITYK